MAAYDATVPASFSYNHKAGALEDASFASLSRIAASYEVDSHVEIIFLSNAAGIGRGAGAATSAALFDYDYLNIIQSQLESLSTVSAFASPLQNVHEKIVYHTNLAPTIQQSIDGLYREAAETGVMDTVRMSKVLESFHSRASTGTTLFVLCFQSTHARNGGGGRQGGDGSEDSTIASASASSSASASASARKSSDYYYNSAQNTCKRQTFLSQDASFGWIDLSADAQEVQPQNSIFPLVATALKELRSFKKDSGHYLHMLASLIHRTGESFNPFPLCSGALSATASKSKSKSKSRSKSSRAGNADVHGADAVRLPPKMVQVLVVTLCAEDERKGHSLCENDAQAKVVIQEISRIFGSASADVDGGAGSGVPVNIQSEYVKFGLNDDLEFAHAYFSSIHHSSTSTATVIDSTELLFWLSSSLKVRDLMQTHAVQVDSDSVFVPIFIVKASPSVETFLDNVDQRTLVASFPEPPGGWGMSSSDSEAVQDAAFRNTSTLIWPENAIISLRSTDQISASADMDSVILRSKPLLQCGDNTLPSGAATDVVRSELRAAMKHAIWGLSPTHTHYSGSSGRVLQDYLWHTPVAMQYDLEMQVGLNAVDSFIDRRAFSRMRFIYEAEHILAKFQNLCDEASSVHPPINSTILFELEIDYNTLQTAAQSAGFSRKLFLGGSGSGVAATSAGAVSNSGQPGLLSDFLQHMDDAAKEFSHLGYASALQSLNNAESRLRKLQLRMEHILNSRTGTLSCKSAQEIKNDEEAEALAQRQVEGGLGWESPGSGSGYLSVSLSWLFSKLVRLLLVAVFVYGGKVLGEKLKRVQKSTRTKRYL